MSSFHGTQKTHQRKPQLKPITLEMIAKAISKMASGKAAGTSGIVAELLKPVGEAGAVEVRHVIENIISKGLIPTD